MIDFKGGLEKSQGVLGGKFLFIEIMFFEVCYVKLYKICVYFYYVKWLFE